MMDETRSRNWLQRFLVAINSLDTSAFGRPMNRVEFAIS